MVTAQEITVALRSTGTDEVADDVNQVEQEFEETSQSVEETAGMMEGFSTEFAGAMTAIMGGLAVAAAGLLSQVPIIGETLGGLAAVFEAIAFQMDQVLRPVFAPIRDALYELTALVFNAEGVWGDFIGVLFSAISAIIIIATTVLSAIAALAKLGIISFGVKAAIGAFIGALKVLGGIILGAVSWPVVLAAALLGLAFVFRDEIANAIGVAIEWVGEFIGSLGEGAQSVWNALGEIGGAFFDWASELIGSAFQWGVDLIDQFIDGISEAAESVGGFIKDKFDFEGVSEDLSSSMEFDAGEFDMGNMEDFQSDFESDLDLPSTSSEDGRRELPESLTANRGTVAVRSFIDGREAARGTSATRFDETGRRGTFR